MSGGWKIGFVTDWDEIYSESFQSQWLNRVENAVNSHVFFHPALCMAWIDTYRPLRNIQPLFCIAENSSAVVFLPLVLWKQNWKNAFRKIIVPVGYSDFDYHDPLTNILLNLEDWSSFYMALNKSLKCYFNYDIIEITGIRTKSSGLNWYITKDNAPFFDLRKFSDSDDYLASLGYNLRRNIQKQTRRLEKQGPLFIHHCMDIDEAIIEIPKFLKLHIERWPSAYKAPDFHRNIILYGIKSQIIDFTLLQSNEKTISYHLGFIYKGRYYCYMIAINPAFEYFSPGMVHLYKLIEYSITQGFIIFDFLRGDENYKAGWTNEVQRIYRFSIQSIKLSSMLRNAFCSVKKKLQ